MNVTIAVRAAKIRSETALTQRTDTPSWRAANCANSSRCRTERHQSRRIRLRHQTRPLQVIDLLCFAALSEHQCPARWGMHCFVPVRANHRPDGGYAEDSVSHRNARDTREPLFRWACGRNYPHRSGHHGAAQSQMSDDNYFVDTTFNYLTMAEAYRVAALNGLNRL